MIYIWMYSLKQSELSDMRELVAGVPMSLCRDDCDLLITTKLDEWSRWFECTEADALICDISKKEALEALKTAKKQFPEACVMPIVSKDISPIVYVRPDLMPCGLFWRPMTKDSMESTVQELFEQLSKKSIEPAENCFELITKKKKKYIPYREIYYFEAYDKKLLLRTGEREVLFHGTLSELEKNLPKQFKRCHKSFVVNTERISAIDYSNQLIELGEDVTVPVSRTYRSSFSEGGTVSVL